MLKNQIAQELDFQIQRILFHSAGFPKIPKFSFAPCKIFVNKKFQIIQVLKKRHQQFNWLFNFQRMWSGPNWEKISEKNHQKNQKGNT